MQIIVSPAKQMRVAADAFSARSIPPFPQKTQELHRALLDIERTDGPQGLQKLWAVSDKLLAENLESLHRFEPVLDSSGLGTAELAARLSPALFSYIGIQYQSMAPQVLDEESLGWLQAHLWILSALYGCSRPFDAIQPYRLEMAAKLAVGDSRNLYGFWGRTLAETICTKQDAILVNLASAEYSKAVIPHLKHETTVITCIFSSSLKNGRPVQKSTESKTARGSMVRWMAQARPNTIEELERFDAGFRFAPELSSDSGASKTLVFMKE